MIQQRKSKKGAFIALVCAAVLLALVVLLENLSAIVPSDSLPGFLMPTSQLFIVLKKGAVYSLVAVSMNLLNGFTGRRASCSWGPIPTLSSLCPCPSRTRCTTCSAARR